VPMRGWQDATADSRGGVSLSFSFILGFCMSVK
jgi:hypothetical protein